jgi:hypothetical protein
MNHILARGKKKRARAIGVSIALAGMVFGLYFSVTGFFSVNALAEKNDKVPSKTLEKAFPHSSKCKRCHLRAYEEWETSAQSQSIETAAFRVTLDRFLKSVSDDQQNMCFQCHAPHILEYGHLGEGFIDEVKSRNPQIDGVGCSQCHLIREIDPDTRPPHPKFALGQTIYGGYNNAAKNLAHESQELELYKNSQYCVTCHDSLPQTGGTAQLPDWLGAWKTSQAVIEGKTCQSCHMPEAFGESANGERSRRVANHSFPGRFGKVRVTAVELEFTTQVKGRHSEVEVTIKSLVPHNLPLPHPGWSRLNLDLTILGKNLKKVYGEKRFYERVYADKNDGQTVLDFHAVKILKDTLLKPEEKRVEKFSFPTPSDAPSMDVIVTLSYAPVHGPDELLRAIEAEAILGRKDRSFQEVEIIQKKQNMPL